MKLALTLALVFSSSFGLAALFEGKGTPKQTFDVSDVVVPVYPEAQVKFPGGEAVKVVLTGAGIRTKTVFKAKVYVAASYAEKPSLLGEGDPLPGFAKNRAKAIHLTFLRDVSGDQVRNAFTESLKENGLDPEKEPLSKLLSQIQNGVSKKASVTVAGFTPGEGKGETIYLEFPGKLIEGQGQDLAQSFWRIWFGKPSDGGLETLKAALLGKTE